MNKISLLSTKKLSSQERVFFSDSDFVLIEEDFIAIELLDFQMNLNVDMLLFTSKNAVFSVLKNKNIELLKHKNCICVGEKTKDLLEKNGFKVLDFAHYAEDLTTVISEKYSNFSFAFFCGNLRRDVLPNFFKNYQINFEEIQVYNNKITPYKITEPVDAILFFSPSGVMSYLKENTLDKQICFCIGKTTAEALQPYTDKIILSKKPTISSVLEEVVGFYESQKE
jgi:uroporphyrinogen-III synthase